MKYTLRDGTEVHCFRAENGDGICNLQRGKDFFVHGRSSPDQLRTARDLGYGDDVVQMCWDHDPLHAVVAQMCGADSYSLLYAQGKLTQDQIPMALLEENVVMMLQRYLRLQGFNTYSFALMNGFLGEPVT